MQAISYKNEKIKIKEPFKGLFTQGMVCHETYKDNNNNWVSPDETVNLDGKRYLKKDNSIPIKVGPIESMSKSKRTQLTLLKLLKILGLMLLDYLYYLIVHQKRTYNGQMKELKRHTNLFKNYGH